MKIKYSDTLSLNLLSNLINQVVSGTDSSEFTFLNLSCSSFKDAPESDCEHICVHEII